ncbi:thiamine phosphate synthase [Desulfosporosinus nitroreducens]|uniref:Thiamine phosphate synthase n=1 Tax=Desulfosporosinus nitroreducens TaxID=2018668 RepID=A0ABT8QQB9_9FIRM|nr:thiamine phosphate synthase [Desulfosporosinus nitroreducens]MDO0823542.1 thiamine phosphate synthase [Desulfosporosinus nitroreducens]
MLICVTNRNDCKDDYLSRISQLAKGKPHAIMLREKDLSLRKYEYLAAKVSEICNLHDVPLIINQNITTATKLKLRNIHLSISDLRQYKSEVSEFTVGASVHTVPEAKEAQALGASYIIAGHIFSTDCKKGVPPRGLSFLKEVCTLVTIPVFAIGGITKDKIEVIKKTGAQGVCVMSESMTCTNPVNLTNDFQF